jgi:LuxR family maltose regulon positive regulatory protein
MNNGEDEGRRSVPAALLETKLYVPRLRRGVVPRRRLSERLDRGTASTLTLVSAPAGFGKTTLLTQWLAGSLAAGPAAPGDERLAAWLSLDRADNDPVSFWTYVIAALRTVAAGVGEGALAYLQAAQPPPAETVLTVLLNDLGASAADIVLVLDDYHVIDAREVQEGMAFLLDHLPPRLHVVIVSRADPALPLARLRARGELVEIRAAELRFTPDEAAAYFNGTMGLRLTARDVAALEGRTEGWIAALQLAALSLQGRDDVAGFIAGFAGDDRYVVDYLVEEVLQRQPEHVQSFLLQTAILGRLSGPVCDAVTGQSGGKATLEALDRGTCSWSRSTTAASGTATTISSLTCCGRGCSTSGPASCRTCTGGRARGTSATASRPRPSATRWPPGISSARPAWSSWRSRTCARPGRKPWCDAGSRRFPTS